MSLLIMLRIRDMFSTRCLGSVLWVLIGRFRSFWQVMVVGIVFRVERKEIRVIFITIIREKY